MSKWVERAISAAIASIISGICIILLANWLPDYVKAKGFLEIRKEVETQIDKKHADIKNEILPLLRRIDKRQDRLEDKLDKVLFRK